LLLSLWVTAAAAVLTAGQAFAQAAPVVRPDEVVLGEASAPVTIIEYVGLTCPACRTYHQTVMPRVVEQLIATGKVRYILRDLPLDERGAAAALLAQCRGSSAYLTSLRQLLAAGDRWWNAARPLPALREVAAGMGLEGPAFEACIRHQERYQVMREQRSTALAQGISVVPTFVIGETKHHGPARFEDIEALIQRAVGRAP
jgi:protein-disulfide isomerase